MHHTDFLSRIEHGKVVAAIAEAEKRTSGEIRVWISHREVKDALESAQQRFHKLGMHKAAERNGVLVYVAPRSRAFAVVGDKAAHEKCGDTFWKEVAAQLEADLKREAFTDALLGAVRKIGDVLAEHFPRRTGGENRPPGDAVHS
ncbi:MAG TPA: TPM domain-containing protein [Chthoniobacteraceae bacterium]|nr:TPM domain-containing protein [Chthoniobacteraceae bacterium]